MPETNLPAEECQSHSSAVTNLVDCFERFKPYTCPWCEIERLQFIQREFHNLDDVAEIKRLRELLKRSLNAFAYDTDGRLWDTKMAIEDVVGPAHDVSGCQECENYRATGAAFCKCCGLQFPRNEPRE